MIIFFYFFVTKKNVNLAFFYFSIEMYVIFQYFVLCLKINIFVEFLVLCFYLIQFVIKIQGHFDWHSWLFLVVTVLILPMLYLARTSVKWEIENTNDLL